MSWEGGGDRWIDRVDGYVLQKANIFALLIKEHLVCSPGVGSSTHIKTLVTLVLEDENGRIPGAHWLASLANCPVLKL